jgi:hypothetical protein
MRTSSMYIVVLINKMNQYKAGKQNILSYLCQITISDPTDGNIMLAHKRISN